MAKRVKKREHEKLSNENIKHVISLLEADKPITKKEACEILNISYNTTRLNNIIDAFKEQQNFIETRKKQNRGRPATESEIQEIVLGALRGESDAEMARAIFRSTTFVSNIIKRYGVPRKPKNANERAVSYFLPDECVQDTFEVGEIVWSAIHHGPAVIRSKLVSKPGTVNYEEKYGSECYNIYVIEETDSSETFFPGVTTGGYNAAAPASELGSLKHLKELGIDLQRI